MKQAESNNSRASQMAYAFVQHQTWDKVCNEIHELEKITKQDIVDFANRICKDNNYVIVFKHQDTPDPVAKVVKPAITPISVSRDNESAFLSQIKADATKAKPIQPVFVNFKKDLQKGKTANGSEVLYVKNVENGTFTLQYRFEFGSSVDKTIGMAANLMEYLNTDKHTAEQLQEEFYKLACSYSVHVSDEYITVSVSGLAENMEKAMTLVEEIMAGAQPNYEALQMLVERLIKSRTDNKTNQRAAFRALNTYGVWGEEYIKSPAACLHRQAAYRRPARPLPVQAPCALLRPADPQRGHRRCRPYPQGETHQGCACQQGLPARGHQRKCGALRRLQR